METLYHYCSNQTFLSIVGNKSVWLSSLSLSNDSMEGKLVASLLGEIAKEDGLLPSDIERLKSSVDILEKIIDGLGLCLSEEGDLLSQWRGYAGDGSGVSIGFSASYFRKFSGVLRAKLTEQGAVPGFKLDKLEYDREKQIEKIRPTYERIKRFIDEGAFRYAGRTLLSIKSNEEIEEEKRRIREAHGKLSLATLSLMGDLFSMKLDAFKEEKEWRLVSYSTKSGADECKFRVVGEKIVPYREYRLIELDEQPIVELVLGPKNLTPTHVVESLLKQNEIQDVQISRSKATYR